MGGTTSGTTGNDSLTNGGGDDSILANAGDDTVSAGDGNDTVYGGDGNDLIYGGNGIDSVYGGNGDDRLDGGAGGDRLYGDAGNDTLLGGAGADSLDGGVGSDSADYSTSAAAVSVNLLSGTASGGDAAGDTLTGIENLTGTGYDDSLTGDGTANTISGGAGQDTLTGDAGNDQLYGDSGNDQLFGGLGDDQLSGRNDADQLAGGEGNDSLWGDAGNDTLNGGQGNDMVQGGADADLLFVNASQGADSIFGGETGLDNDTLAFGDGSTGQGVEVVFNGWEYGSYAFQGGGSGNFWEIEHVTGTGFADTITGGGAGGLTLEGGAGNDQIRGGDGNDALLGGAGDDTLSGGPGSDTLFGGDGADTLQGGAEADTMAGDAGNDTLDGGSGNDVLSGGDGNDLFRVTEGGGVDWINDFNMAVVDGHTADQLDLSSLKNADGTSVKSWDITVSDDGHGNAVLTFPGGEGTVLTGISPAEVATPGALQSMGVPCLATGSLIATPSGPRAIESLQVGDMVVTQSGIAPVIWQGHRALDAQHLAERPDLRPIRLKAGHFGLSRDLIVSPQHAVRVGDALIRARHLAEWGRGANVAKGLRKVTYHHVLLPRHALLQAEGAWVESFYPGRMAIQTLDLPSRIKVGRLICRAQRLDLQNLWQLYGPRCLPLLTGHAARLAAFDEQCGQ